jgi:hypothetical protein
MTPHIPTLHPPPTHLVEEELERGGGALLPRAHVRAEGRALEHPDRRVLGRRDRRRARGGEEQRRLAKGVAAPLHVHSQVDPAPALEDLKLARLDDVELRGSEARVALGDEDAPGGHGALVHRGDDRAQGGGLEAAEEEHLREAVGEKGPVGGRGARGADGERAAATAALGDGGRAGGAAGGVAGLARGRVAHLASELSELPCGVGV